MRHLTFLLTFLVVGLLGCNEPSMVAVDSEPAGSPAEVATLSQMPFRAENDALFNLGFFSDPTKPSWIGVLTHDTGTYGIVFYSIGSGKSYPENVRGRSFHFEEIWEVYTWVNFDFGTQILTHGDLLLSGSNVGIVAPNDLFHSDGTVEEAYGEMAEWLGAHEHTSGYVVYTTDGLPESAHGEFRLN